MRKAQTATEYLIILAVVIVIALIVVGVIGGIPSIGSGTSERNTQTYLRTQDVGVDSYSVTSSAVKVELKNNRAETLEITAVAFYNGSSWVSCSSSDDIPVTLLTGEKHSITCSNTVDSTLSAGERYSFPLNVTYTEKTNNVQYTVSGSSYKIEGKIGVAASEV